MGMRKTEDGGHAMPYEAQGKILRKMRERARITMQEFSERSVGLGFPLSISEISSIESGRTTIVHVDLLWAKLSCPHMTGTTEKR